MLRNANDMFYHSDKKYNTLRKQNYHFPLKGHEN